MVYKYINTAFDCPGSRLTTGFKDLGWFYLLATRTAHNQHQYHRGAPLSTYNMKPTTSLFAALLASTPIVSAGPAAYGICQAGCAAVVTACYAAAGFTWGATAGLSIPATIVACNTGFGTCQAACCAMTG
ncbi:hypothetical protein F4860DRAFT_249266 [Xylaria cubensis]|nr:hypothetical protein F4860DRAFT_249266 [Xylaria cubensis]